MDETSTPTAAALSQARSLLASIDHPARRRLGAEARLALVADVVALGRQVEALRAVLVAEAMQAGQHSLVGSMVGPSSRS